MKNRKWMATVLAILLGITFTSCSKTPATSGTLSTSTGSEDDFFETSDGASEGSGAISIEDSQGGASSEGLLSDEDSGTESQDGTTSNAASNATSITSSSSSGTVLIDPKECTLTMACIDVADEKAIVNAISKAFMKKYPKVKVVITPINGDYNAKILAQAVSKTLPDVLFTFDTNARVFGKNGVFIPIDSYLSKFGFNKNDYVGNIMDFGKGDDGKTYMIPREYSHLVTGVNLSIIESSLGMSKTDFMSKYANWTMDEFIALTKQLTVKDGAGKVIQYGADINYNWEPVWTSFAVGYGGTVINSAKKATFSNTNTVNGLKTMLNLVKDGYAADNLRPNETIVYPFTKGQAAFLFLSRPSLPNINSVFASLRMDWDILPFPRTPVKPVVGMGTTGYGVSSSSKNPYEAALLAYFVATEAGQKAFIGTGSGVPVIKSLSDSTIWKNYPVVGKNSGAFISNPSFDYRCEFSFNYDISKMLSFVPNLNNYFLKYLVGEQSIVDSMKALDTVLNG